MANKKLKDLSNQELQKRKKTLSTIIYAAAAFALLFVGFTIYQKFTGELQNFNALPFAAIAVIMSSLSMLLSIVNAEIRRREKTGE